jgi:hypothetical protein
MTTTTRKTSPWVIAFALLTGVLLIGAFEIVQLDRRIRVLEDYLHFRDHWANYSFTQRIVSDDKESPNDDGHGTYYITTSNQVQRFQITNVKAPGKTVAGWIGDYQPRSEMLKFDEFYLVPDSGNRFGELVVKPKVGETINMTFTVHLFLQN